ncbi:hypothetical protein QAD02_011100 [Eretmocerus hayati]|uniref:Uncharacterized protein n=1 Tax=Eretmocerus hayati TaxID=131215 RepID=A0ACC2NW46_9HYME|nr:hypothetical protein QAD02_011100 [Eretmocerus hayati]
MNNELSPDKKRMENKKILISFPTEVENKNSKIRSESIQIFILQLVNGMDGTRYMCESEVMDDVSLTVDGATEYSTPITQANKNTNGNIITLTLRNNHLIVETEERAVTMESTRFRQYQDNGCSVIVEVPPPFQSDAVDVNRESSNDIMSQSTDEQALVHCEISGDRSSGFNNTKLFGSTNTGLSQSDLSICSSQDGGGGGGARGINPSYRYGNQLEYDADHFGYTICTSLDSTDVAGASNSGTGSSKWVEFDRSPDTDDALLTASGESNCGTEEERSGTASVVLDNRASTPESNIGTNVESLKDSGSSLEQQDSTETSDSGADTTIRSNPNYKTQINGASLEPSETDALMPQITTKPVITGAILKDEASLQEDTFQEQQRKLGNGTLTPEHRNNIELQADNNMLMELKNKDLSNITKPEGSTFVPTHKRTGSIPPRLIEDGLEIERKKGLDIYSQIKTSTKSILPGLSPKFELLENEISPIDEKES